MFVLFLMLFLPDNPNDQWQITETSVFQPLVQGEVLVRPDGGAYILNFKDALVTQYDITGRLVKTIGGKGKGPGEFTYPVSFFYENEKLFVYDYLTTAVSVFDDKGTFEKQIRVPHRNLELLKVHGGWIYADWDVSDRRGKPQVFWADETFAQSKAIVTVEDEGYGGGMSVWSDGTNVDARFSPISNQPKLIGTTDGKGAWLTSISSFELLYINAETKTVSATITRKEKRIPFDVDWADEELAERIDRMKEKPDYTIKKMYPEYFPIIRDLLVLSDGTLVVDRWRGKPDSKHYPVGLEKTGKETPLKYDWETQERVRGIHNGFAYVTIFNAETEEAGLARVPLANLSEFAKKNPIIFEGHGGRSISISD